MSCVRPKRRLALIKGDIGYSHGQLSSLAVCDAMHGCQ